MNFYRVLVSTIPLLVGTFFTQLHANYPDLIAQLTLTKNKVQVTVDESLSQLIREDFFVEYLHPDIDLKTMDTSIVTIPFIMNIAPIIWFTGKEYSIDTMDEDLYYSLKKIKKTFKQFYPHNRWTGNIKPKELIKHVAQPCHTHEPKLGVLFSGGLDAVCSSLRHQTKKQLLITVWGSDVHPTNKSLWYGVKNHCTHHAKQYGHEHTAIKSNICQFYNGSQLSLYNQVKQRIRWWPNTLQGLGYTSLTMPLLYAQGCTSLIIGSTRTHDYPLPYGTHPLIDNNIHCASIQVFHDAADLDRVEKIAAIIHTCNTLHLPIPTLRVCWGRHHLGGNCCACEKCIRTIVELISIGQDYFTWGFPTSISEVIANTQQTLIKYLYLSKGLQWHWRCIQRQLHTHTQEIFNSSLPHYYVQQLADMILETAMQEPNLELDAQQERDSLARAWKKSTQKNQKILKERLYNNSLS